MGHDNQLNQIHRIHGLLRHVCNIQAQEGVLFVGLSKCVELVCSVQFPHYKHLPDR